MGSQLKLKEIIWEITGKCNNGCEYCGSKDIKGEHPTNTQIKNIALEISNYLEHGEINISGGDPLLIDLDVHKFINNEFKRKKNKIKILINPKSFYFEGNLLKDRLLIKYFQIISLYDLVGVSINTEQELFFLKNLNLKKENKVIVTNFNLKNIWEYDILENFVKEENLTWQIQYTMGGIEDNTLYNNESACKYMFGRIESSMRRGTKIILADNINEGKCSAGIESLGVLNNGDVVPCLSMRSWDKDIKKKIQGNLLKDNLKDIWEEKFKENRFGNFVCCKDICNKPFKKEKEYFHKSLENFETPKTIFPSIKESDYPRTMVYGINFYNKFGE